MASLIRKVKRASIYSVIGRISEQVAGVVITWLLVTKLPVEDYGIYNLLAATGSYLTIFSSWGLIIAFQRYLPEFFQKKEYAKFRWTVKFGLGFRAIAATISSLLIVLFFDTIGPFFQIGEYRVYFAVFAVGIFFSLQARLLQRALQAMFLHKYAVYADIAHALVRVLLLFITFYLGYGLLQVLIVDGIAFLTFFGLSRLYYTLNGPGTIQQDPHSQHFSKRALLKRLFRFSSFSAFNEVGKHFIDVSTDFFIISHFLGPSALAYYAFSARIGVMVSRLMPSRIMRNVVAPAFFARYTKTGDKSELNRMFCFLTKMNGFLMFPILALLGVYGVEIIHYVFDPQYVSAYPVMMILLVFFMMLAFPVALALEAVEKPELVLIGKISSVYNLVMDIVLVQIWGIMGVAIATASSMVLKKIFEYSMSRKHAGITIPWIAVMKIIMNCLIIVVLGMWLKVYVVNAVSLALVCAVSLAGYLGVSYVNKVFLPEERDLINKATGRNYFVF